MRGRTAAGSGRVRRVGIGGAIDVAFAGHTAYVLVTLVGPACGQPDVVNGIYRIGKDGNATAIADFGAWSIAHPPATDFSVPSGVQYALETFRGGLLVSDGHHNRVPRVSRHGEIRELAAFGNVVPTGLEVEPRPRRGDRWIVWAIRGAGPGRRYGGGGDDQLPARGALGAAVRELVAEGAVALNAGFQTRVVSSRGGAVVLGDGEREIVADEVIAATGFRPDLTLLGELRLELDDRVEAPRELAPLIDPNLHSCGSVPPHGVDELSHPDAGVYVVGMKSYGRAPTFLLRTGYEQVRSVVAALAGDWDAARRVELVLPETGVCSRSVAPAAVTASERSTAACCGAGSSNEAVLAETR